MFHRLEGEDYNILKWLGRYGPQSLFEMGKDFRRWSIQKRLLGSKRFFGLIPNGFVHAIPVSNKREKYDLTMKGLLAVLAESKFENIHLVQTYKHFLEKQIKKKKLVMWSLDFIKHEITLILYYNYLQGLDWSTFSQIRVYWDYFKNYDDRTAQEYFVNTYYLKKDYAKLYRNTNEFFNQDHKKLYLRIGDEYLKFFSILDLCTFTISWGDSYKWYESRPWESDTTFRKFIDRWYLYIDSNQKGKPLGVDMRPDSLPFYDEELLRMRFSEPIKQAYEILRKNGYELSVTK